VQYCNKPIERYARLNSVTKALEIQCVVLMLRLNHWAMGQNLGISLAIVWQLLSSPSFSGHPTGTWKGVLGNVH
jgi:hypothetical protein